MESFLFIQILLAELLSGTIKPRLFENKLLKQLEHIFF